MNKGREPNKRPGIAEVAAKAKVDPSTVSRVLSGDSRISAATAQRVRAAARKLGYVPHSAARALARGKTQVITVVVPSLRLVFPYLVLKGIEKAMMGSGYHLRVETAYQLESRNRGAGPRPQGLADTLQKAALGGEADGVILVALDFPDTATQKLYSRYRVPLVMIEGKTQWGGRVSMDNLEAGRLATAHLLQRGRRRLALVNGNRAIYRSYAERRQGFLEALRGRGCPKPLMLESSGTQLADMDPIAQQLVARRHEVDGLVVAAGDLYALRLMDDLQRAGIRVPEDMAVIGFDDIPEAEGRGLTTIMQPFDLFGERAVTMLLDMIKHGQSPGPWLVEPALIIRKTS